MFESSSFGLVQLNAVNLVMEAVPSFRPMDKTPAQVALMIAAGEAALTDAQVAFGAMNLARGEREEKTIAAHDLCVSVYPIMKNRFKKDIGSSEGISRLPVEDGTPGETLLRMQATSGLWLTLPNPPGSATPFKAWDTMGRLEFDAVLALLVAALQAELAAEQAWDLKNGDLKESDELIAEFVASALVQGRAQYAEGTPERAQIDGIPTDGSNTPLPGEPEIQLEASPGPGSVAFLVSASHATTFEVYEKAPGAPDFVLVEDEVPPGLYVRSGLEPGNYEYKIIGVNSRGSGPESGAASITVV